MREGGYDLGLLAGEDRPSAAEGIVLKLHASCGSTHPLVDALLDLKRDHPELRPERVESIVMGMGHPNVRFLGQPYRPVDATSAQFRVLYCVAAVLLEGQVTAHQFRDELIVAPQLMRLVERIKVRRDAEIDAGGVEQRNAARVDITLVDGSKLSARRQSREAARETRSRPNRSTTSLCPWRPTACRRSTDSSCFASCAACHPSTGWAAS